MRKIVIILAALFSAAIVSSAQQLDSAGRVLLDEKLAEYVAWLRDRILANRVDPTYMPVMHMDV